VPPHSWRSKTQHTRQSVDPCTSPQTHHECFGLSSAVGQCKRPRYNAHAPNQQQLDRALRVRSEVRVPSNLDHRSVFDGKRQARGIDSQPSAALRRFGAQTVIGRGPAKRECPAGGIIIQRCAKSAIESPPPTPPTTRRGPRSQSWRHLFRQTTVIRITGRQARCFGWAWATKARWETDATSAKCDAGLSWLGQSPRELAKLVQRLCPRRAVGIGAKARNIGPEQLARVPKSSKGIAAPQDRLGASGPL